MGLDWRRLQVLPEMAGTVPEIELPRSPYGEGKSTARKRSDFYFGEKYGHKPGIWVTNPWGKGLDGIPFSEATRKKEMLALHNGKAGRATVGLRLSRRRRLATTRQHDVLRIISCRTYGMSRETCRLYDTSESAGGFGLGRRAVGIISCTNGQKSFRPSTTVWRRESRCFRAEIPE